MIAIIVVDPEKVKMWAKATGLKEEDAVLYLRNADLKKTILNDLNRLATENKLSGLEKIKKVHLIADPFTIENDILTPKMSLKRHIAKKVFE